MNPRRITSVPIPPQNATALTGRTERVDVSRA